MRDAIFFEHLFPHAGNWKELKEARRRNTGPRTKSVDKNGNGTPVESIAS